MSEQLDRASQDDVDDDARLLVEMGYKHSSRRR